MSRFMCMMSLLCSVQVAQAATHPIVGCLEVEDRRSYGSRPTGDFGPLAGLSVEIEYKVLGVFVPAIGSVDTDDNGCINATLSGFTVPNNTDIRLRFLLDGPAGYVYEPVGGLLDVWSFKVTNTVHVNNNHDPADFQTLRFSRDLNNNGVTTDDNADHHSVMNVWLNLADLDADAMSFTGAPLVTLLPPIEYPATPSATLDASAWATPWGLHLTSGQTSRRTFYHEMGHWTAGLDGMFATSFPPSYDVDTPARPYPMDQVPYIYAKSPDSGHSFTSYEAETACGAESYASFVAAALITQGTCSDVTPAGEEVDEEYLGLHFDDQHREDAVMSALCDLVDSGAESTVQRHIYSPAGAVNLDQGYSHVLTDLGSTQGAGVFGIEPFEASPGVFSAFVYEVDALGGLTPVALGSGELDRLTTDDDGTMCAWVFGQTSTDDIQCLIAGVHSDLEVIGAGPAGPFGLPYGDLLSLAVRDGYLFALTRDAGTSDTSRLHVANLNDYVTTGLLEWQVIANASISTSVDQWSSLAINQTATKVYIGRENTVLSCNFTVDAGTGVASCSAPALYAGAVSTNGFKRASRTASWFGYIRDVEVVGNFLYIGDAYGVARINLTAPGAAVEQYIGRGADSIYLNNLSRRSLGFDASTETMNPAGAGGTWDAGAGLFGVDAQLAVYQVPVGRSWSSTRSRIEDTTRFYIDLTEPMYTETYCGAENVALAPFDVVHAYIHPVLGDYYAPAFTLLSYIPSATAGIRDAVQDLNFLTLESNECVWVGGEDVMSTAVAMPSPPPEADSDGCGGTLTSTNQTPEGPPITWANVRGVTVPRTHAPSLPPVTLSGS